MKQRESLTGSIYYIKATKRWRAAAYEYDLDDNRSLKTKQFKTKTEAKKWLEDHNEFNKIQERKRNGGHLSQKNVKIKEFSQIWLARKKIQIKPRSYDRIESFTTACIAGYNNTTPVEIEKLSKYLGHSSVEVTRAKYVHAPEVCTL